MHQEESPAELLLFADGEIKQMAQKKKNSKTCKISTRQ